MQKPLISASAEMGGFVLVDALPQAPANRILFWVTMPWASAARLKIAKENDKIFAEGERVVITRQLILTA